MTHHKRTKRTFLLTTLSIGLMGILPMALSGCAAVGIAAGAGATLGVAATQEGGLKRASSDAKIQATINDLWFKHDVKMFSKLDLTVNQARVLVTGVVQNPEHRVEAIRLAWLPPGVEQVINEVRVADSSGIVGYARDAWVSTRLRTSITLDKNVQSINYNIDTVQGIVYLMGTAQNRAELDRVIETARTIPDVKQVVSYVKILNPNDKSIPANAQYEQGRVMQPIQRQVNERTAGQAAFPNTSNQVYDSYESDAIGAPIVLSPIEAEAL